jgi:drug/metabolite transporter (DMT)-like permease
MTKPQIFLLTALTMMAFAANSLLCRWALKADNIDAVSFTFMRLATGAIALAILQLTRGKRPVSKVAGSWWSGVALLSYAGFFSWAYVGMNAGVGAFVLFVSVQITMIGWSLVRGERLSALKWLGVFIAVSGLALLTLWGADAPPMMQTLSMMTAGLSWGIYSLRGRSEKDPVSVTAGNFIRTVPLILAIVLLSLKSLHWNTEGLLLATSSGVVTSAMAYSLWYFVLRHITSIQAAIVQLSAPVLAVIGGNLLLSEAVSYRTLIAGALIVAGITTTIRASAGSGKSTR